MTKVRRSKGLSGTVLIMILTVMVVLIIMLVATLSVVTTANQRIYTKFEENQAYYSARSALDIFTDNLLADSSYYAYDNSTHNQVPYKHGDGESAPMKQGLALQLDLYKIQAQEGHNVKQSDLNTASSIVNKDEYVDYFGTDSAKVENNGLAVTDPDYKEFIRYYVELPETVTEKAGNTAVNSDAYGKMADWRDVNGNGKYDKGVDRWLAEIKVEVLDRRYNVGSYTSGGTEVPVDATQADDLFNKQAPFASVTDTQIAEAVASGSRKKDTMKVKITSTITLMGTEGTAVLIYDTNEPPTNNSSRAITAFGAMNGTNHAYIVGGVSMIGTGVPGAMAPMRNGGGVFGTVYDEMGLDFNVNSPIYLTEMEYVFVAGDFKGDNDVNIRGAVPTASAGDKDKRPFIFIGGTLYPYNNFTGIGGSTPTEAVDIVTLGNIVWSANSFGINGDIYCGGDASFDSTAGKPNINGAIYIAGNLYVGGNVVTYTTMADGSQQLTGVNFGSGCDIYVGGNIIWTADNSTYAPSTILNNEKGGNVATFYGGLTLPATTAITDTSTGDKDVTFKLPKNGIANQVTKVLETHKTNYDQYYYVDSDGNYTDASGAPSAVPVQKTPQTLADDVDFTDSSIHPSEYFTYGMGDIDTAGGTVRYVLEGGQNGNGAKIHITGGGTVEFYLVPSAWSWDGSFSFSNGPLDFIIDDKTTVKIYGGVAGVNYNFHDTRFMTETIYDAWTNGTELNVGSESGFGIKVPKIYYYFDGGEIHLDGGKSFLSGYVFAPTSKLYASAGSNIKFDNLKYNGASVDASWKYTILGSLLCNDFEFENDHGVIYINPGLADDGEAGEPIHSFDRVLYTRY